MTWASRCGGMRRSGRASPRRGECVQVDHGTRAPREPLDERTVDGVGDERPRARVGEHGAEPLRRVGRLERHVELAGLQDGQRGDHGIAALTGQQRDRLVARPAAREERVRDPVGRPVQVRVAQSGPRRGQREAVRPTIDLGLEPGDE